MPFESDAQRRFMYSQHPEIAKRWREESGPQHNLPEHVTKAIELARKAGEHVAKKRGY